MVCNAVLKQYISLAILALLFSVEFINSRLTAFAAAR